MYLFVSIILSLILAYVLFIFGPYGAVIGIGIVLGCLFRGLYLLHDIHRKITKLVPDHDKVKEVYENYLQEERKLYRNKREDSHKGIKRVFSND